MSSQKGILNSPVASPTASGRLNEYSLQSLPGYDGGKQ